MAVKRLDTLHFSAAISELSKAITTFEGALRNIQTKTSELQSCWSGKGADKFKDAYQRLKKEFDDQKDVLTAIRDDLQTMLETYEEWDLNTKDELADLTKPQ